jgi:creatinine amidohydrolase
VSGSGPVGDASLGTWTSPEVGERRPVLLVPLGSTEQHGPHLPLDTDTRIAVALCHRVATSAAVGPEEWSGPELVVAPAVAYGASGEHQGFPGTLSVGEEVLERTVVELARSAGPHYACVVLVNAHGGNARALAGAIAVAVHERRDVAVWSPRVDDGDSHAGRVETSVLLALDAGVVRLERAEPGVTAPLAELMDELRAGGLAAVTANGVLGDPTGATAEEGQRHLQAWSDDLLAFVRDRVAAGGAVSRRVREGERP